MGHVHAPPEDTPPGKAMGYYFEISESTKNCQGKTRMTIAISIQEDLRNGVKNGSTKSVQQFTSIDDSTAGKSDQCHLIHQKWIRYYTYKLKRQRRRRNFLFYGKAVFSFLWWSSDHCLCSVVLTFHLFRLKFLVYLYQGLPPPLFCTCLKLRWLFLGESRWIVHDTFWCVQ